MSTPDRLIGEYNEEIAALRAELVNVEDHEHSEKRSLAIRSRIRDLIFERDMIPPQRDGR